VARASKRDNRRAAPKPPPDGYELALKLLALRPHSTMELGRKLRQRGCSGAEVEEVLERARARGYLDDEAFARALVAQRSTVRGPALIAAELAAKGVPRSLARAALESLGREEQVAAAGRLAARIGPGDPSRAAARLQRRGFAGNVIREALDGSLDDLGGPEPE
jgi:regulatory protein